MGRTGRMGKTMIKIGRLVLVFLLAGVSSLAFAQRGPAAGQTVEKIRQLKPNLYLVTGGGANTLIRVTTDGLIVVDTKNPGDENYRRLMEEIASVSNLPVKYVLNTHHHPDHVGNNQRFIDAGAQVVGLDALKARMASDPRTKDIPGLPTMTFARDYMLKLRRRAGGRALVRPRAHGRRHDDVLPRPESRHGERPDHANARRLWTSPTAAARSSGRGSSTACWRSTSTRQFPDAASRRAVRTSRLTGHAFATFVSRAADAVKAGATKESLATSVKTDDLGWQFAPPFYAQLYDELSGRLR